MEKQLVYLFLNSKPNLTEKLLTYSFCEMLRVQVNIDFRLFYVKISSINSGFHIGLLEMQKNSALWVGCGWSTEKA